MASVFPFEIYDEIIELIGHEEELSMAKFTFLQCSLVCHSWHWKCRPLVFRSINFIHRGIPDLYAFRAFITSAPHLAELIEEVHLREYGSNPSSRCFVSVVEIFHRVIAKHLPRLSNIIITTLHTLIDRLSFHPYFAYSRLQLHTVTTLKLKGITFGDTFELDRLLMPFPNIHTLDMYEAFWMPVDLDKGDRLPRLSRVVPVALADLRIAYRGSEPTFVHEGPFNLVGLDQLLRSVGGTLKALSLNLPVTRALTMVPQWNNESDVLFCHNLSEIHLTLDCRFKSESRTPPLRGIPSSAHIAAFPRFLLRLESANLRRLILTFDIRETIPEPLQVLEELRKIRETMEVAILGRFPRLKTISFDVGSTEEMRAWWSDRIGECFPLLYKKGMIDVILWIRPRFAEPALVPLYPSAYNPFAQ